VRLTKAVHGAVTVERQDQRARTVASDARDERSLVTDRLSISHSRLVDDALTSLRVRHREYQPFLIVTRARTGSNMLISALQSHPNVHAEGELLQQVRDTGDIDVVLHNIFRAGRARSVLASGFKIFYYHPLHDDSGVVWEKLRAVERLRVVHLKRRNRLRTFTSRQIADRTNEWIAKGRHDPRHETTGRELTLRRRELEKYFEQGEAYEAECEARFAGWPMLDVYYEDLAADLNGEVRRVTRLLGVPDANVHAQTRQQNPEPLSQLIANYEELADAFRGTRWSEFFDS
jgi:LPS sulfotransferase NodH